MRFALICTKHALPAVDAYIERNPDDTEPKSDEEIRELQRVVARFVVTADALREYAEEISSKVKYYELAADKDFQKEYINSLYFPHSDLTKYPKIVELLRRFGQKI